MLQSQHAKLEERAAKLDESVTSLTEEKNGLQLAASVAEGSLQGTIRAAEQQANVKVTVAEERLAAACAERDAKQDECNRLLEQLAGAPPSLSLSLARDGSNPRIDPTRAERRR